MRPTARIRDNLVLRTAAKLCGQYLKWFGNASYKPARNGERWLLDTLSGEPIRTVLDVGANMGTWSLMAGELFPDATIYALEVVPDTAAALRARVGRHAPARSPFAIMRRRAPTRRSPTIHTLGPESGSSAR